MQVIDQETGKQIILDRTPEFDADMCAFALERCEHSATEVRRRNNHFARQCNGCGAWIGNALKRSPEIENAPNWDFALEPRYHQDRENKRTSIIQKHVILQRSRKHGFWKEFNEYLLSDAWRGKRAKVIQRAQGICEGCLIKRANEVHHLTYEHRFNEFMFELVALCDECHRRLHADQEKTEGAIVESHDGLPCEGCRWQSTENNRQWCGKLDMLALEALAADGECGPEYAEFEPLK